MNLVERIELMSALGNYLQSGSGEWQAVKQKAFEKNGWFTAEFVDTAVENIVEQFLQKEKLETWTASYFLDDNITPQNTGIVMAGNIPLVGFHDFLSVFISGHHQTIKLSAKDDVLMKHIIERLHEWEPSLRNTIKIADILKGCDAYIATGSDNTARYFDYYFGKYPHIIRRNRTSVAVLTGKEDAKQLELLADDVHMYFGLGCRNVTSVFVPEGYDFVPMLDAFKKYEHFAHHTKYRNNYDYNLALLIMNNVYYMTNEVTLLVNSENLFSPISQLNYQFYNGEINIEKIKEGNKVQCVVGPEVPFGESQKPMLTSYPDGVDTMQFLLSL